MTLRETTLSAVAESDDGPPARILTLSMVGEDARLQVSHETPDGSMREVSVRVPARSLLLALRAAWDDTHGRGSAWCDPDAEPDVEHSAARREPGAGVVPAQRERPPQTGQRWSQEQDDLLRGTWLASAETTPAGEILVQLAAEMGRTRNGVRSRLVRVGCDPDVPGRALGAGSTVAVSEEGPTADAAGIPPARNAGEEW